MSSYTINMFSSTPIKFSVPNFINSAFERTRIDCLYLQDIFHPFEEEEPELKLFLDVVINISHLLIATNSAVNIVVYFLKVILEDLRMKRLPLYDVHIALG